MLDTRQTGAKLIKQTTEDEKMNRQQMVKIIEGMIQSQVNEEIELCDTTLDGSWKRASIRRVSTGMELLSFNVEDSFNSPAVHAVMGLVDATRRALA